MKVILPVLLIFAGFVPVARADQEVKQVEIEARLMEINSDYGQEIGVDLGNVDAKALAPSTQTQAGAFGDTVGVKKIPAVTRTLPLTSAAPANPPLALKVVPKISPNGNVIMDVNPEVTDLTDTAAPKVETTVKIPDSTTMTMGGLKTAETFQEKEESPIISNIPILGRLFRHEDKTREKKDLVVLVTPTLVSPAKDSE